MVSIVVKADVSSTDIAMDSDNQSRSKERARNFRHNFSGAKLGDNYRGIPIYAAPGLHELAFEKTAGLLSPGASVLELGAGGGAMSLRLSEAGYDVTASDLDITGFFPGEAIRFQPIDLNQPFAPCFTTRFDAVVALELIEHLENPHQFLRQCAALLKPEGVLVLSTPNLANPVSQAMFLREGVYQWFRDEDYREQGHITPLAPCVIVRSAKEAGLQCVWQGSVADPIRLLRGSRHRRLRAWAGLMRVLGGQPAAMRGEVWLAVFAPDAASK